MLIKVVLLPTPLGPRKHPLEGHGGNGSGGCLKIHFFSAGLVKAIYYKMGGFLAIQCCIEASDPSLEIGDGDPPLEQQREQQDPFSTMPASTPMFTPGSSPVSRPTSVGRSISEATTLPAHRHK